MYFPLIVSLKIDLNHSKQKKFHFDVRFTQSNYT